MLYITLLKCYRVQPWYTRRCRVTVRQYYLHNATCEDSVPYYYMNFSEYMHAILGAYQMDAELYFKRHALGWAAALISKISKLRKNVVRSTATSGWMVFSRAFQLCNLWSQMWPTSLFTCLFQSQVSCKSSHTWLADKVAVGLTTS